MAGVTDVLLQKAWVGGDDVSVLAANEFALTVQPDTGEFCLTVGHLAPPPLMGSPEEVGQQAGQLQYAYVRTIARLSLTAAAVRELAAIFQGLAADQGLIEQGEKDA